jgi:putative peptidoglycan lipid II flippase
VFSLLLAIAGGLSLLGIFAADPIVTIFATGFEGLRHELTVQAVRIIFPMTGVLVLSAWALGVLNSHRHFFVPYVAPVLWNAAMIGTLVFFGGRLELGDLTIALAWGALAGGVLQFAVQLPAVLRLERELKIRWDTQLEGVRTAVANAGPAIAGRGVVQLSAYVDMWLAAILAEGAVAALGYAQTIYMLPVSLFGISVAAAELPELARNRSAAVDALRARVNGGLRRLAVFVVPSAVAFLLLGDVLVGALYQTGEFGRGETLYVYVVLIGYTIGLLASTATRLFSSAFFALHDTKTPAKVAAVRVVLAGTVGAGAMFWLRSYSLGGYPLGAVGLSVAAGLAAWVEWTLLRRSLRGRIGDVGAGAGLMVRLAVAALAGAGAGRASILLLPEPAPGMLAGYEPVLDAVVAVPAFALVYFGVAHLLRVDEAGGAVRALLRRRRKQ